MTQSLLEKAIKAQGADSVMNGLSEREREALPYLWEVWARPNQLPPPGDWLIWLFLAGRGTGKTRSAAEFVRSQVEKGLAGRIALIGRTPADVRDVMVEGESGILNISPPWNKPVYEPSIRRLTWPNGAIATTYSSHEPDQIRGPQHDLAWCDELRNFYFIQEVWDNLMLGLRLGDHPRCIVTTTPSPVALLRAMLKMLDVVITRGSTYENRANLAASFFNQIVARYEGTILARQEIYAELLDDVPGALWHRKDIKYQEAPTLVRAVVAIDPAVTATESSDETGIVAAGKGVDGKYYVLADRSGRVSPNSWAQRAIQCYHDLNGDRIVAEANNGGDMVELTIRTVDKFVPFKAVHASRGKVIRAEPVAALYEQGQVFHVKQFPELEDQLVTWTPESGKSPDRLDALVWALSELVGISISSGGPTGVGQKSRWSESR